MLSFYSVKSTYQRAKKTLLALAFISFSFTGFAAIPENVQASLTSSLTLLSTSFQPNSTAQLRAADINARNIFAQYNTESDAYWRRYFIDYFRQHQFKRPLYNYLSAVYLRDSNATTRDRLQYAMLMASVALQGERLNSIDSWQTAFNDSEGFVDDILNFSHVITDMLISKEVMRYYNGTIIYHYDYIFYKHGQYLKKFNYLTSDEFGYLSNFREQTYSNLASIGYLQPSLRLWAKNIIGINRVANEHEKRLFDSYSIVVQENGTFADNQFKMFYDLLQLFRKDFTNITQISGGYPFRKLKYGPRSIRNVTAYIVPIGFRQSSQIGDGLPNDDFDVFFSVLLHEFMHQIDGLQVRSNPILINHQRLITRLAGDDPYDFLRIASKLFYTDAPQEFIASNSNNYFADTKRAFDHALRRYHDSGRTLPLDTFLLLANLFSDKTNSSYTFQYDYGPDTTFKVSTLKLKKNAAGYITELAFSDCEVYQFTLDAQNLVSRVTRSVGVSPASTNSGDCVDSDKDNDGRLP